MRLSILVSDSVFYLREEQKNASFYKQGSDIRTSGPPAGAQAEGESVKC